jgi:hypothetical protein
MISYPQNTPLVIILFFLSWAGCSPDSEHIASYTKAKVLSSDTPASELIESFDFILLDSVPGVYLGGISKVILDEKLCFVRENRFINGVFIFDRQGNYLRHIYPASEGLNPVKSIYDFTLDKENNVLYILDGIAQTVFVYDYNLRLKNQIFLGFSAYSMERSGDIWVFATTQENENIIITDASGMIIHRHFASKIPERRRQLQPFYVNKGKVLYNHWEDNDLYVIDSLGRVTTYYSFKFPDSGTSQSYIRSFAESNNKIVVIAQQPEIGATTLICTVNKGKCIKFNKVLNDITHDRFFLNTPIVGSEGDFLITYIPAEYILNQAGAGAYPIQSNQSLTEVFDKLSDRSNPLLIFLEPS